MNPVPIERRGDYVITMYDLEDESCRRLLERSRFGRVGFVGDDGPEILPVNAMFSHGSVLFRTAAGSPLDRNVTGHTVAFEVDNTDTVAESGWSVLVRGTGNRLTDPDRLAAIADTEVHPWAPGPHDQWMEIRPERISGRIIRRQRLGGDTPRDPYMPPD
jgi:nitroimidazol reductase NimA-like FMN-containing flavoprotein (pyridoxamine 5'-phosphate oxidase superfamily)